MPTTYHVYAETTPDMHPWEYLTKGIETREDAERIANEFATTLKIRVRVGNSRGHFLKEYDGR